MAQCARNYLFCLFPKSAFAFRLRNSISEELEIQIKLSLFSPLSPHTDDEDNKNKIAASFPDLFDLSGEEERGIKSILDELICNITKSNIHFFT